MNPLFKDSNCISLFITDGLGTNHENKLRHIINNINPDIIISDKSYNNNTFNFFTENSKHIISNLYLYNDHQSYILDTQSIIITNDISYNQHYTKHPKLLIGLGDQYANFLVKHNQWFGIYKDIPWIVCGGQVVDDLSFIMIYIDKTTNSIRTGTHSFEWMFWSKKCYRDSPNSIFTN